MDSGNHNRTPSLAMLIQDFGQRSEHDLADEFGVSHGTVRHATAILRERGLIASIHGRGTYVASVAGREERCLSGSGSALPSGRCWTGTCG